VTELASKSLESVEPSSRLSQESIELVRRWLADASALKVEGSARQLAGVLKDPNGLAFTVGFVDGVVRPEDLRVAARNLRSLSSILPAFLPWYLRAAIRIGAAFAPILPQVVVPIARKVFRNMVGHLIIDATDSRLGNAIAKIRRPGVRLNINLLGEAVLGEHEAARRLAGTSPLLQRDDVDYVSIKVSSTVSPHSLWAFDEAVDLIATNLSPLFAIAAVASTPKFINLDMEEYKDLDLTIAVFTRILEQPEFLGLPAGIVLQAYLPDALSAMIRLQEWAAKRRANGGAHIKVRLVKGANLPMEEVEASIHDWPLATWSTKQDSDTNYKRVLEYALRPERIENVRIGVAGHNLFDIAFAWLLANERSTAHGIEFEMLLGMAQAQAEVVKRDVGSLLLYTPVVHPQEFDVAIAYLIRRLEEGASQENFMSAVFELADNEALFSREQQRCLASLDALDDVVPAPNRQQDRNLIGALPVLTSFENTPDTDPSLPANRLWGRAILERILQSSLGVSTTTDAVIGTPEQLDTVIQDAVKRGTVWRTLSGAERADILRAAARSLERHRADLIEVMASETGKTIDQGDPEVSEAIDFANYYADRAAELDSIDGAKFVPSQVTVVTPPWNFPVAIPAGSTLAALAAGSAVIIKPAQQAARSGAVMVEALWEGGVPREALQLVSLADSALGQRLISDPRVDRVILTGGYETAELFRSFRPDLQLLAETSGKNAIIVTPSADLDLAARDVVNSAFGHAGQKCSAASLVILVGSVASSKRFHGQLVDAVRSLKVGYPTDPTTQMGPIIEPARGKMLSALTTVHPGESWIVEPSQLDETGKLWSPGIRGGVRRGSEFHLTEYFGPVLGIMTASSLEEAIAIQNDIAYGLTSGIHSLDAREIRKWLDGVEAGNLYVNRGITGAIVRRQPFGGWKKSAVGTGNKAGGPNYLLGLGEWVSEPSTAPTTAPINDQVSELISAAVSSGLSDADAKYLQRATQSDAAAWASEFGQARDVSQVVAERNIFRYRPVTVNLRLAAGASVAEFVRVVAAGFAARAQMSVSAGQPVPDPIKSVLRAHGVHIAVENEQGWISTMSSWTDARVRMIGGNAGAVAAAVEGRPDIAFHGHPVTESGRVEMLPFLREQAVSITAHRFGNPNHLTDELI
jgi:RHH-type proline utilization regulon transcriptional repressor/proline dehydrogenase/delta 1-pyrroline-5-carboxylate dehydrogenase